MENFTTELVAWTVNWWPAFGRSLAGLVLGQSVAEGSEVRASTQVAVPGGFVDLELRVIGAGQDLRVFVEHKVEAGIGMHGPDRLDDSAESQLDCYLRHAQEVGAEVALVSKYRMDVTDWRGHLAGARPHRWHEVADILHQLSRDSATQEFIAAAIVGFLREHGMTLERVGPALQDGTRQRHKLQLMFEEAAANIGPALKLRAGSARSDRFAVYLTVKDAQGREVGGPAYSDVHGDAAVWLSRDTFGSPDSFERLRSEPELVELTVQSDRWWGCPFIPLVEFDATFFDASAGQQLQGIEDRLGAVLGAAVRTLGPG